MLNACTRLVPNDSHYFTNASVKTRLRPFLFFCGHLFIFLHSFYFFARTVLKFEKILPIEIRSGLGETCSDTPQCLDTIWGLVALALHLILPIQADKSRKKSDMTCRAGAEDLPTPFCQFPSRLRGCFEELLKLK